MTSTGRSGFTAQARGEVEVLNVLNAEGPLMPRPRTPNTALAALVSETDWSYEALARAVNRVGAETGLDLHYDRTSVAHWLTGSRPRPPVPALIAEAAARRLGRPVPLAETGMGRPESLPGAGALDWQGGTVSALAELGRADMDISRRRMLRGIVYSVAAAAAVPAWEEIAERAGRAAGAAGPRVGEGEVEAVSTMAEAFSTVDDRFGGGHARSAVAAYIANDLAGWLHADAAPGPARRRGRPGLPGRVHGLGRRGPRAGRALLPPGAGPGRRGR
ncbi:hypothetical protein J0910_01085 [Nocardiopsis sp. CNT-189]|uniref:hypothetical protein n=1 Tax=Nocardiopsis oceanisediminis TaxID=2816862 RepID=UPI003B3174E1